MRDHRHTAGRTWTVLLAALALVLAGCGGERVGEEPESESGDTATEGATESEDTDAEGGTEEETTEEEPAEEATAECGTVNLAVNPWTGYEASAAVFAHVAQENFGCEVVNKNLTEEVSWQGFASGEVDIIIENWGHEDLKERYIENEGVAVEAGSTGNVGLIGWYVPPWLAEEHPEVTDWQNLNDFAAEFQTSESGGQGQLLDGDPSFVTNDEALVSSLDLNYQVVYAGSETALIQSFRTAEQDRSFLIGYFWEPHWLHSEVPLVKVELPEYTEGCDADPESIACDYPEYDLDKVIGTEFAESGSPAVELIQNFNWTNDDQNLVSLWIEEGMSAAEAAAQWVGENPDKVEAWLPG